MKKNLNLEEEENLENLLFHSKNNDFILRYSNNAGCYSCQSKFKAKDVKKFSGEDEANQTGLCPSCGKPTVVADAVGTINIDVLRKLKEKA